MTLGINPALAAQLRVLRAGADPARVTGGMLAWWGPTGFPDGAEESPALAQPEWERWYARLEAASMVPGRVPPLYAVRAMAGGFRSDGPLPIAVAHFRLDVPSPAFAGRVKAAALAGRTLDPPPADISAVIEPSRVFLACGLLGEQWGSPAATFRSRVVTMRLEERFWFAAPGDPLPEAIELDPGDGLGPRRLRLGESATAAFPRGDSALVRLRCRIGSTPLASSFTIRFGAQPCAPPPDETWVLRGMSGNTGRAYVYRAAGRDRVRCPLIVAEGFPGGYPYTYLYDVMNQAQTLERLRQAGHDVLLLSFDQGADAIEKNAAVAIACIERAAAGAEVPVVAGGVSMGGLVMRHALLLLEARRSGIRCRAYFSVDTPHGGAYTSLADQWFVHAFSGVSADAALLSNLLDSPANQQFMMSWLHDGAVAASPLRQEYLARLAALGGYPQGPRRYAISCGRGDGARSIRPLAPMLEWSDSAFFSTRLRALPEGAGEPQRIAEGWCGAVDAAGPAALAVASDFSWEGAPGGTNVHTLIVAQIAQSLASGLVDTPQGLSCAVPTVSALDLKQGPFEPVPAPGGVASPFHDYHAGRENLPHLTITEEAGQWLLDRLGPAQGNQT